MEEKKLVFSWNYNHLTKMYIHIYKKIIDNGVYSQKKLLQLNWLRTTFIMLVIYDGTILRTLKKKFKIHTYEMKYIWTTIIKQLLSFIT